MRDYGYGFFPGGDPRKFTPDPECSTELEQENHRKACYLWDKGETPLADTGGWVTPNMHVTKAPFGLGTYWFDVEDDEA